ncbi:hypothetical protein U9M48_032320 [Paspalum notatum var. saurae]|uniref:Protein kinase domain-containing protein n=1 Tax=Paspalum notatum var. saurae TaxID=547442 RepID=A0AAQ3U5P8_PASNO
MSVLQSPRRSTYSVGVCRAPSLHRARIRLHPSSMPPKQPRRILLTTARHRAAAGSGASCEFLRMFNFLAAFLILRFLSGINLIVQIEAVKVVDPAMTPSQGWEPFHSMASQARVLVSVSARPVDDQKRQKKLYSSPVALSSAHPPISSPSYSSMPGALDLAIYSSDLSHPLVQHKRRLASNAPAHVDADPPDAASNSSAAPSGLVQPRNNGCCAPNMVQKRGTRDCHCVYPVRVELFLGNVSLVSNWSNEFLQDLAFQLGLRVNQFEIVNFYVIGASGLNITMDIAPHTGNSFAADQVNAINYSLSMHTVRINPVLVEDYNLLNLTWFRPLTPVPAPAAPAPEDGGVRENMHDKNEEPWSIEEEDEDGERTSCQLYSYQVLEAATCRFSNSNKLGSGGFGTVFRGTLENGKVVAVKRIRDSKKNMQELEREISIVANLRHKNLVRFLGYCFQEEGRFLIYEYVPNNSLEKFWYRVSFQPQKLDWAIWFNIVKGVAGGLRFLHRKGIIHRDLKPHNVLLDEKLNPKIADFDLIRMYDKQKTHESTEKVAGTFGYMAPECTSGRKFLLSIKSDVYSYGVLVLEIITGHKIYTFEGQNSEGLVEYVWQHWTEKRVGDVVDGDLLGLEGQEHALRQAMRCVHVALLCVQADRSKRPDMGPVITMLRSDGGAELPEPSLPGYVVRSTTASGVRLRCMGYR